MEDLINEENDTFLKLLVPVDKEKIMKVKLEG
jgi:hypothetical protein